jgi:hypothetical protein
MHSYLIVSNNQRLIDEKIEEISPFSTKGENIPDLMYAVGENSIGIDEIREVKSFLRVKPFRESHKVVIVRDAARLTLPAQNALLKTLEEPPENSIIVLTAVSETSLLPTIVSRCEVIHLASQQPKMEEETSKEIELLVSTIGESNVGKRVSLAGGYAYPKEKGKELCVNLIYFFRQELKINPTSAVLHNLELVQKSFLRLDQNVDPKLTMEHLFLNIK